MFKVQQSLGTYNIWFTTSLVTLNSILVSVFLHQVDAVRAATSGAIPPAFTAAPAGCELRMFKPATEADVIELLRSLPDKQCSSDPTPTC
jgi:hypothetical protein